MIGSKSIPIIAAAVCGLALMFQGTANAQAILGPPPILIPNSIVPNTDLQPGNSLLVGFAMRTYSGYLLTLQQDGNVVLYCPGNTALWQTNTYGAYPIALTMQMDSNLVLYWYAQGTSEPPQKLWDSNTHSLGPCVLDLDYFGTLSILQYNPPSSQQIAVLFSRPILKGAYLVL
jgi:hypothetical protein